MKNQKLVALIYFSMFALVVTPSRADLPPDAQAAVDKGILAAKESQDYLLAIRYFQKARKIAPDAPDIYYKLGVAESKIPGRELRAICWLEAYLTANPNAPNAAAVKKQIDVLDVKSQSNLSRIIKPAEDSAKQMPGPVDDKDNGLVPVVGLEADAGDLAGAKKLIEAIGGWDSEDQREAWARIATAQANAGDIIGALETAKKIQSLYHDFDFYYGDSDKTEDAKKIAIRSSDDDKCSAMQDCGKEQIEIAKAQLNSGDFVGGKKTLVLARNTLEAIHHSGGYAGFTDKPGEFVEIAETQIQAGDIDAAQDTLISARKSILAAGSTDLVNIIKGQIKAGDVDGAKETAQFMKDSWEKDEALKAIANAPVNGLTPTNQSPVQSAVVLLKVSDWLNRLDDDNETNGCALNTPPFWDVSSYLTSLPASDNPHQQLRALCDAAEKIAKAQNIIDRMLKQQAKQTRVKAMGDDDFTVQPSGGTVISPPHPPPN